MNATQLRGDLKLIEEAIGRADATAPVKRILGEVVEWSKGLVSELSKDGERIAALEAAVDDLLQGAEEGITQESAKVLLLGYGNAGLLCQAVRALLEGDQNPFDDITTRQFTNLVSACEHSVAEAMQLVSEIVIEDDETEEGPSDPDGDEGEGDDEDAELEDDEAESEEVVDG